MHWAMTGVAHGATSYLGYAISSLSRRLTPTPGPATGALQNGNASLPAAGPLKRAALKAARDADGHGTPSPSP